MDPGSDSDPLVRGTDPQQNVTDSQHCLQDTVFISMKLCKISRARKKIDFIHGTFTIMRLFPYFAVSALLRSNVKINKYILKSAEIFKVFDYSALTHSKGSLIPRGLALWKTLPPRGLIIRRGKFDPVF
jgi:hypothetical protein